MNIYCVISPVESHLGAARLFPSKDEQENIFRGFDGQRIKFEDIAYTDKLAEHEKMALHYKRFLLLVCGLDHRLKLFGDFYEGPTSLDFVSLDFQRKNCRFLHDDEKGSLLVEKPRLELNDWIAEKNSYLTSGSRVLCYWSDLINPKTAPGACKISSCGDSYEVRYSPQKKMSVEIAYKNGLNYCVSVPVSGSFWTSDRVFNCKVNLIAREKNEWASDGLPFLCLDNVSLEELRWYVYDRETRIKHLSYIRLFKLAINHIEKELEQEAGTRQKMLQALEDGGISTPEKRAEVVNRAVIAWRAIHRGKPLPDLNDMTDSTWKSLLNQMYLLANSNDELIADVQAFASKNGLDPLRLAISGNDNLYLYVAPAMDERDDRFEPHAWVDRLTIERGHRGGKDIKEKSRKQMVMQSQPASEITLHQWEEAKNWFVRKTVFKSIHAKKDALDVCYGLKNRLDVFRKTMNEAEFELYFNQWFSVRKKSTSKARFVRNPRLILPFGVIGKPHTLSTTYLCLCSDISAEILAHAAPDDDWFDKIKRAYIRDYSHKDYAIKTFEESFSELKEKARKRNSSHGWSICTLKVSNFKRGIFFYDIDETGYLGYYRKLEVDETLNQLLKRWHDYSGKSVDLWMSEETLKGDGKFSLDELFS